MGGNVARAYTIPVRRRVDPSDVPVYVLGQFDETAFRTPDVALAQANAVGVRLIIPLLNNWKWMGGVPDYAVFRCKAALSSRYGTPVTVLGCDLGSAERLAIAPMPEGYRRPTKSDILDYWGYYEEEYGAAPWGSRLRLDPSAEIGRWSWRLRPDERPLPEAQALPSDGARR
jgi:hypothetical protein